MDPGTNLPPWPGYGSETRLSPSAGALPGQPLQAVAFLAWLNPSALSSGNRR